jgi:hypothetical protein
MILIDKGRYCDYGQEDCDKCVDKVREWGDQCMVTGTTDVNDGNAELKEARKH